MLPSTPKMFKRTKRVLFARRMNYMDRPLIIINFQGVLGDFIKMPAFKMKEVQPIGKSKTSRGLVTQNIYTEEKMVEHDLMSTWRGLNLR